MSIKEINEIKVNESFFGSDKASFDEVLKNQNIVKNMKFQYENPLENISFNEYLSKVFDCR